MSTGLALFLIIAKIMKSKTFEGRLGNNVRSNRACRKQEGLPVLFVTVLRLFLLIELRLPLERTRTENRKKEICRKKKKKLNSDPEQ